MNTTFGAFGGATTRKRVLIATSCFYGGVTTMASFISGCLVRKGLQPVVAYYQPYSIDRKLSVPFYALLSRRTGARAEQAADGREIHQIGAWLPELEFTHYFPTQHWRTLIDSCDYHVAVSGTSLASFPFASSGIPFVSWVATPWREDRRHRERELPLPRRILDFFMVRPLTQALERRLLKRGTLLALSDYTRLRLNALAGRNVVSGVMPMPIDTALFSPYPLKVVPGRIGLTSRIDDRRKNVELFIESIALCRERGLEVTGILVGGTLSERAKKLVDRYKLGQVLKVLPFVPREQLPSLLQTFDIYLLPSKQEGLCIAALEAMACGCPVISTRCGGPEEFVQNGKTGYLVDFAAEEIAMRIEQVFRNRQLRSQLSEHALHLIKENYSTDRIEDVFWRAFEETFYRRIW